MGARKILIVDDDADYTIATTAILEASGYTVISASEGQRGLELARAEHPDLIILDIMMSYVLEGFHVGEALQAEPSLAGTPVLMLSSIARTEHVGDFPTDEPLPAQHFLTKPVPAARLVETVRWMLGERAEAPAGG